jgi:hypothetical protein
MRCVGESGSTGLLPSEDTTAFVRGTLKWNGLFECRLVQVKKCSRRGKWRPFNPILLIRPNGIGLALIFPSVIHSSAKQNGFP